MNTSAPSSPEVRAVICDLYGTLLKVAPPPPDAAERWESGLRSLISGEALSLAAFDASCRAAVADTNGHSRRQGEAFPEVDWLDIILRVLPCLPAGDKALAARISRLHAACSRTCTAMPGAAAALALYRQRGVLLGIASNAQDYTRSEFTGAGFQFSDFQNDLVFISGEHGFAKPSPRVFARLAERLAARGISPGEILMAGDSRENDILPAATAGWQTRLIGPEGWV